MRLTRPAFELGLAGSTDRLGAEFGGLDALDLPSSRAKPFARRIVAALWPKLFAVVIGLGIWQAVVLAQIWPSYVLPGPAVVARELASEIASGDIAAAIAVTIRRAFVGYAIAVLIGTMIGILIARSTILRAAIGSLITGLQTMPSIAWFPLAILLFSLSEGAITFVVVL